MHEIKALDLNKKNDIILLNQIIYLKLKQRGEHHE